MKNKILPGTFGGVCLEVVRLYKIHVLGVLAAVPGSQRYWWLSVVFVLCAGGVAHIWDDQHPLRSFYVGLSFPALIAAFSR